MPAAAGAAGACAAGFMPANTITAIQITKAAAISFDVRILK